MAVVGVEAVVEAGQNQALLDVKRHNRKLLGIPEECLMLKIIQDAERYRLVKFVGLGRLNVIMNDLVAEVATLWEWNVIIMRLLLASTPPSLPLFLFLPEL